MKFKKLLENWDLTKLKVKAGFLEAEWNPQEADREAAWEFYVEMITRIVTQPIPAESGDEKAALESIHSLFGITREILRRKGRDCVQFTKIAVIVLNQFVRPFTTKWHKENLSGALDDPEKRAAFRQELSQLQEILSIYSHTLANIAEVEDLTSMI